MIVDSSALVCVAKREDGFERILEALAKGDGFIPAPVLVEATRVASRRKFLPQMEAVFAALLDARFELCALTPDDARAAAAANARHGSGLDTGGKLNLTDLMVYATAKNRNMPILCTGENFPATDAEIHPASRPY